MMIRQFDPPQETTTTADIFGIISKRLLAVLYMRVYVYMHGTTYNSTTVGTPSEQRPVTSQMLPVVGNI